MKKKKLDELFQERFLDFKEAPDNKVWRSIEASLDKRRKKRAIPLWWQIGGIAAAVALGLFLFNPLTEKENVQEIIVDTNKTVQEEDSLEILDSKKNTTVEETSIVQENTDVKLPPVDDNPSNDGSTSKKEARVKKNTYPINKVDALSENSKLAERDPNTKRTTEKNTSDSKLFGKQTKKTAEYAFTKTKEDVDKKEHPTNKQKPSQNTHLANSAQKAIANHNEPVNGIEIKDSKDKGIASNEEKKSIFEEIKEQENNDIAATSSGKWSAGPSIAPVYFNAVGKGSPVNSIFVPNSKSGNINLSYGVSVAYAVSKKLTIRSGINKVDYGYNTEDVAFSSSQNSLSSNGQLSTIDYAETSSSLTISSKKVTSEKYSIANNSFDVSAKTAAREGFMSQQLGYLELPLEMNYALLDKKFGINLIGGVSSLFLIDNAVSLTSGELTTEIGKANNINNVNFSANMGFGLNYRFSPKFRFNIEPIFKYQLNTFSEINGTFRPYSIGVYSGVNFKF